MPADWKSLTHDILRQIHTFCEDGDLSRCARTCKNWTDPALDLLWFELQAGDFVHLFSILAPLQPAQSQPSDTMTRLEFTRRISHNDWKRFIPYASRVRTLNGDDHGNCSCVLHEDSLAEFLMTKPSAGPIFPRCRRLNIDVGLLSDYPWCQLFTGFLHEGIQDVRIFVAGKAPNDIPNFLEEVVWRSPNVTSLSLESAFKTWDADIAVSLSSSIAMMHKLTVVITYSCLLTAQILSSLEQLPDLQDVEFYTNSYRLGRVSSGLLPQSVRPRPFPSLTSLSIQSSFVEFCRYLSLASGIAPVLRHLFLDVISNTKPSHFQNALVKIAEAFPLLETLQVARKEDFSMFEEGFADPPVLTHENILPIANMRSLRTLRIRSEAVFSMTNSELCALLSRCTSLVTLELNQEPMVLSSPTELTIHVLPMIAQACPQLEDLALYIDTNVDSESPPTQSFRLEPFVILEWISFGISPLQNKQVIATLLSQVLPEDCELSCVPVFDSDVEKDFIRLSVEDVQAREVCREEWAQVAEWIPILKEARRQGRLEAMNGLGAVNEA